MSLVSFVLVASFIFALFSWVIFSLSRKYYALSDGRFVVLFCTAVCYVCSVPLLFLISYSLSGRWEYGIVPIIIPFLAVAFLGATLFGAKVVEKGLLTVAERMSQYIPLLKNLRNDSGKIIVRLQKRVGDSPAWQGVLNDVKLLSLRIPKIRKEILNVKGRIEEVKETIARVDVEGDGNTPEGREIKDILCKLERKLGRLKELELRMRQTIGLAHARSALSDDGESAERLQEEVAGLMQSADREMGIATKTGNELEPKKQHGARAAAKRTA
jgi:hypothetical protein